MFSTARQFYILEKGENPTLKIGQVESISQPVPKYNTTYVQPFAQKVETVVDIKAKIGDDEPVEFKQLPADGSIFTYSQSGVVVSDSREAMSAEIEAMQRNSQGILDSIEMHRSMVARCHEFLQTLNPEIAEKEKMKNQIQSLENQMGGIRNSLKSIEGFLSVLTSKKPPKD